MAGRLTQANRQGRLDTVLGEDVLVLVRMDGEEELSGAFEWRVAALSEDAELPLEELLGTHATVTIDGVESQRHFDGIVTEAHFVDEAENGSRYDLVLKPWLHLASLRRNQRIFHAMTVIEILEELFEAYASVGETPFEVRCEANYPELEYTVQYGESDAAFAMRMMERFGIGWHYIHAEENHTLVLTDRIESHDPLPGGTRPYYAVGNSPVSDEEHLRHWHSGARVTTGSVRLTEYNFKFPNAGQEVDRSGTATHPFADQESFDWPGDYLDQTEGRDVVARRIGEETGQASRHTTEGNVPSLGAGSVITVTGQARPGVCDQSFLCLKARHVFRGQGYGTMAAAETDSVYDGTYVLMPAEAPLVPERRTPRPIIQGPQTAVVVGEGEIDPDRYGRVLVRFHWDLDGAHSMRCRVSQNWASKGWGGMVIPRIGMEVIVEHLEGDPDKPIVTGCVYNGANMPPYSLPAGKTKSTFKSDTHQGGGYNEFMFDDEKDAELVYLHGQKDQQIEILNDRAKTIGRDQDESVGRDKSITVGQDHSESITRDARHTVGRDVIYQVGQNQQEKYGKDHVHFVGNIHKQDIYADHLIQTGRNREETVLGRSVLNVNESITNNTKTHTLMAFNKMVLKGPGGKITIDASGITLEAAMINLKGKVSMGGMGSAQVPTLQGAAKAGLPLVEECLKQKED